MQPKARSPIAKTWRFASSSGSNTYETLQFQDGTTSCDCPGWTRRLQSDGSRSCKHVRSVAMGDADSIAIKFTEIGKVIAPVAPALQKKLNLMPQFGVSGRRIADLPSAKTAPKKKHPAR